MQSKLLGIVHFSKKTNESFELKDGLLGMIAEYDFSESSPLNALALYNFLKENSLDSDSVGGRKITRGLNVRSNYHKNQFYFRQSKKEQSISASVSVIFQRIQMNYVIDCKW